MGQSSLCCMKEAGLGACRSEGSVNPWERAALVQRESAEAGNYLLGCVAKT